MASDTQRQLALDRIRENIARDGHHVYLILGAPTPRFTYTIGASESIGVELILAGALFYMKDDVVKIIGDTIAQLKAQRDRSVAEISGLGSFTLRKVDSSWATELMLGAFDYYHKRDISALQIVPDKTHWTVDIPDMSAPWSPIREPVWQWLHDSWFYPVPKDAMVVTNLAVLRGSRITEAMRWEDDDWELFAGAGPDVPKDELRVVPLGTLVAIDESLVPVMTLPTGNGLWRDSVSEWHAWITAERRDPSTA